MACLPPVRARPSLASARVCPKSITQSHQAVAPVAGKHVIQFMLSLEICSRCRRRRVACGGKLWTARWADAEHRYRFLAAAPPKSECKTMPAAGSAPPRNQAARPRRALLNLASRLGLRAGLWLLFEQQSLTTQQWRSLGLAGQTDGSFPRWRRDCDVQERCCPPKRRPNGCRLSLGQVARARKLARHWLAGPGQSVSR